MKPKLDPAYGRSLFSTTRRESPPDRNLSSKDETTFTIQERLPLTKRVVGAIENDPKTTPEPIPPPPPPDGYRISPAGVPLLPPPPMTPSPILPPPSEPSLSPSAASVKSPLRTQVAPSNEQAGLEGGLRDLLVNIEKSAGIFKIPWVPPSLRITDTFKIDKNLLSESKDWPGNGSHANFQRGETIPLQIGDPLGHGMNGEVVEATSKEVKVALKRIYHPHGLKAGQLSEIGVLQKLEHHHIVKLVGTYTQHPYLGLLIWPVARCDLTFALESMEMNGLSDNFQQPGPSEKLSQHSPDIEELRAIVGTGDERIWASFGCLSTAVSYLHENNIRHKDIKPSNILLSRDGIWITDFGSSKDFTPDHTSTSESQERGTPKYCAPEVFSYEESNRSADIFSLGCVFLEMLVVLSHKHSLADLKKLCPLKNRSYQANLVHLQEWLALAEPTDRKTGQLVGEIERMLSRDRFRRPTAKTLSMSLSGIDDSNDQPPSKRLYGPCCDILGERRAAQERIAELEAALNSCHMFVNLIPTIIII